MSPQFWASKSNFFNSIFLLFFRENEWVNALLINSHIHQKNWSKHFIFDIVTWINTKNCSLLCQTFPTGCQIFKNLKQLKVMALIQQLQLCDSWYLKGNNKTKPKLRSCTLFVCHLTLNFSLSVNCQLYEQSFPSIPRLISNSHLDVVDWWPRSTGSHLAFCFLENRNHHPSPSNCTFYRRTGLHSRPRARNSCRTGIYIWKCTIKYFVSWQNSLTIDPITGKYMNYWNTTENCITLPLLLINVQNTIFVMELCW